mmetsp:Transcript_20157/g.71283  ORF Transcript_20157/g.71283 Transcript_20157/m.71283 type:complete len:269 (+) Transcript_20157:554-1360(+)
MTSSSVSNGCTVTTGPKISSVAHRASGDSPVITHGSMKLPRSSGGGSAGVSPPHSIVPPSSRARATYERTFSRCIAEESGPSPVASSIGSPHFISLTAATKAATYRSNSGRSTKMREPARHTWPWLRKAERTVPAMVFSKSQSAKTMVGFLPPSSSDSFLNMGAAVRATWRPVTVPPVKEIIRMSSCATMAAPTSAPSPCTTLSTPGGRPTSVAISASTQAVRGVSSEGLATMVLPIARHGATFHDKRYSGRFQGVMRPHTPMGWRSV